MFWNIECSILYCFMSDLFSRLPEQPQVQGCAVYMLVFCSLLLHCCRIKTLQHWLHSRSVTTLSSRRQRASLYSCSLRTFLDEAFSTWGNMLPDNEDRFWHGSMWNTSHAGSMWCWTLILSQHSMVKFNGQFRGHLSHLTSVTRWRMLCISGPVDQYVIREQPLGGMSINSGLSATTLALSSRAGWECWLYFYIGAHGGFVISPVLRAEVEY